MELEVEEWLQLLDDEEFVQTAHMLDRLGEQGNAVRMPRSRALGGRAVRTSIHLRWRCTEDYILVRGAKAHRFIDDFSKATEQRATRSVTSTIG